MSSFYDEIAVFFFFMKVQRKSKNSQYKSKRLVEKLYADEKKTHTYGKTVAVTHPLFAENLKKSYYIKSVFYTRL